MGFYWPPTALSSARPVQVPEKGARGANTRYHSRALRPVFVPLLAGAVLASVGTGAHAQALEPRSYANLPIGMNFLIAGYSYSHGGLVTDPSFPLEDAELKINTGVLAYTRSLELSGKSAKFDVVLPIAHISGTATYAGESRERDITGMGDPQFRFSYNFYGAPALSLEEFAGYRQNFIVGASVQISAPMGQYDPGRLVNVGTNRWSVKPEIGVSKEIGKLTLELNRSVTYYTDNDNFLDGHRRQQDPIYAVQGHVIYSFRHGIWVAMDATYYTGGQTTVDGVTGNDLQRNSRAGLTVALPVNRYNSVKLYGSSGVSTRTGSNFDTFGIAWQTRWGAGL
jgi:hypothetical protein